MKIKATYYHAGCPVCVDAEQNILNAFDKTKYDIEIVHLGEDKSRIVEAERLGIKSVPAIVIGDKVYHINFGASIADLKK